MAENEYLDATQARLWQSLVQAIRERASHSEIAERSIECLQTTARQIRKELPFAQLVSNLNDPPLLRTMCHQIPGFRDVKDFLIEASDQPTDWRGKITHFLNRVLDNCLYDVPSLVAWSGGSVGVTEVRGILPGVRSNLQPEIHRIAKKLGENPAWTPRRAPRREKPASKGDNTQKMLGQSLLVGFPK